MAEEAQETSAQVEQVVNKRLGETDVQDFSLWHHLIFCQDLENDDENGALCRLCNETVSGPAYKCSKCNFHQHKLCIDRPHGVDIEAEHKYWWKRHHLILVLDLDRGGEEKIVVCSGCKEPTFGPAYKCSIPECTFLLHKSCGNLPSVIAYPEHPEHSLFLQEPSSTTNNCVSCRKNFSGSVFYRCYLCSFNVDIRCLNPWRVNANDCHQHKLFPLPKQMQFICKSCGEEINGFAYLCSECRVLIHRECDSFPHTINTTVHDHFLNRTYYLPQFEDEDIVFCKLCYEKVNTEYAAYYCWECGYVVHLKCAKEYETTELVASNSVGYLTHLVHLVEGINLAEDQKVGLREINHFSHPQHNLILGNEKLMDDMRCKACMQFIILAPFYGCAQCKFFLHNRCAKLPATIKRGLFHEHSLTLNSSTSSMDRFLRCRACTRKSPGFTYRCGKCFYSLDVQCCLIPETLKHEGHQHSLLLAKSSVHICNACGENWKGGVNFKCTHCKFILCIRCATLPLVAKYQYDKHLLKLSYKREDNLEEHYCLICEEERDYPDFWFYGCVECKFTAHLKCILGEYPCFNYGITFMRGSDHPHPVTSVEKTEDSTPCDVCHESFVDMALECTACKSVVHEDCLIDLYYEESESSEGSEENPDLRPPPPTTPGRLEPSSTRS